jgi:anti-sigma factor RsiW
MTCRDFLDFLLDYESGDLTEAERKIFDAHLAECPACVSYLKTYRQTIVLSKAAFCDQQPLPADVPEELVQAILAVRSGRTEQSG